MGIINILDVQTSNMIAAGEVVDRPASAVKELIENSIDAGATRITVEIKGGGIAYLRVTDNGRGISKDDMPKTILRHATSKIRTGSDIDGVMTLGFRGEALAAISSVSKIQIISKQKDAQGYRLYSDGDGVSLTETGCADGTSVIVEELFYNTPARRKFLKKDSTEAAAVSAVVEKEALANPDIRFRLIVEGTERMASAGDGKLYSAIYTVCGRDFASALTDVSYDAGDVKVTGYITEPAFPRGSRSAQTFYVNGRYIKSKTVMAALEEAYKSFIPPGKFPGAVLFVAVNPKAVDVNVHPAKTEVRFANERAIFEAVYCAVRNKLTKKQGVFSSRDDEKKEKEDIERSNDFLKAVSLKTFPAASFSTVKTERVAAPEVAHDGEIEKNKTFSPFVYRGNGSSAVLSAKSAGAVQAEEKREADEPIFSERAEEQPVFVQEQIDKNEPTYRIVGELFDTYLIAQKDDKILMIDKHAAHERILYEQLKDKKNVVIQELLTGVTVDLTPTEADMILQNTDYLADYGFIVESFGSSSVIVRSVPVSIYKAENIEDVIREFAYTLSLGDRLSYEDRVDKALFTVACKSAIKAGWKTDELDAKLLFDTLLENGKIRYCPHGRPIVKLIDKKEIDRFFDR